MIDALGIESMQLLRQQIRPEVHKKHHEKTPSVQVDGLEALPAAGRLPEKESSGFVINH